jgi:dihydrofolate reductase
MRKVIGAMKISLDGKTGRGGDGPYADWVSAWSEDFGLTPEIDACLLGGGMYPEYEQYWTGIQNEPKKPAYLTDAPPTPAEITWATLCKTMPHYVLSKSLSTASWPNTRFLRNLDEVAALKRQPGKHIYVIGGPSTVANLIDNGLVDELRLLVYPVIAGAGVLSLLDKLQRRRALLLRSVQQLPDGRVHLVHEIVEAATP